MALLSLGRLSAIAAIGLACATGLYGVFVVGFRNGFLDSISLGLERHDLPACPQPFKWTYTGVHVLDETLLYLVAFFCLMIDAEQTWNDRISNWYLLLQWVAPWTLLCLEATRKGNRGRPAGWTSAVGCIFQLASYTLTVPLYLIMHLLTSPVAAGADPEPVLAHPRDIELLPTCITLSMVIPTILMYLPAPGLVSVENHYILMALWQPFPLWHFLLFYILKFFTPYPRRKKQPAGTAHLESVSAVYRFALAFAIFSQVAGLVLALAPASIAPSSLTTVLSEVSLDTLNLGSLTSPPTVDINGDISPTGLAPLAAYFLKFDIHSGNTAVMLWAFYQYSAANASASLLYSLAKTIFWMLLSGPGGAAVVLLWGRDQALLGETGANKRAS